MMISKVMTHVLQCFNVNFAIIFLLQGVSGKLYKDERNAVESVSFERLKCEHRSAQHCAQTPV